MFVFFKFQLMCEGRGWLKDNDVSLLDGIYGYSSLVAEKGGVLSLCSWVIWKYKFFRLIFAQHCHLLANVCLFQVSVGV